MMQRVWANLIENAVKYSGQKPKAEHRNRRRRWRRRNDLLRQGQWRRLRHAIRRQAVRRVPAPSLLRVSMAPASDWPSSNGSSPGTAAGSGPKARSTREPPFTLLYPIKISARKIRMFATTLGARPKEIRHDQSQTHLLRSSSSKTTPPTPNCASARSKNTTSPTGSSG